MLSFRLADKDIGTNKEFSMVGEFDYFAVGSSLDGFDLQQGRSFQLATHQF